MKCELTYQETLNIVEKFMINSGIRRYCTEICKGQCCMGCYENNLKSCRHCEGRRLPCSIYICWELKQRFSEKTIRTLSKANCAIRDQYFNYGSIFDIYFDTPNKAFFKTIRFPKSIKKDLEGINIEEIKKTMTNLIMMKIAVYDL